MTIGDLDVPAAPVLLAARESNLNRVISLAQGTGDIRQE